MGRMDITYLGLSSFRIRGKSASLVTDPYDQSVVGLKYPKTSADIVTVSHQHDDHNKVELVSDVKRVVDGPGEYEISGISIIGTSSFHDTKKGAERGKNVIYLIEIDGLRVVHLGDLGHKLSEKILESLGEIDVLMIPVGGFYTIDAKTAAQVARDVEPNIILPMHYLTKEMNKKTFGKISGVESFLSEIGLPVEKTDKLTIRKEVMSQDQKVVVLGKR